MVIKFTSAFRRQYKKLPKEIKNLARERINIFQKDIFNSRLKTHKLQRESDNYWSFSINYSYRLIFTFDGEIITLCYIGDHTIYHKL